MYRFIKCLAVVLLLSLAVTGLVDAQSNKIPLELGQWVQGELTGDKFETKYTFHGTAGQVVSVAMMADPDATGLDCFLVLRNSDGDIIAQNDDVLDSYSLVIAELPAEDDYTVLATRYNGASGDSTGKYWIRANEVESLSPGAKVTIDIATDDDKRYPRFYVMQLDSSSTVKFGFNEVAGTQYPQVGLFKWLDDNYPDVLISASYVTSVKGLAFSANLDAGDYYVLMIDPVPIFNGTDSTATVAFTIG
jgi:hypothetical protein